MSDSVFRRFWEKVSYEPNSGCWLWCGSVTGNGYGYLHCGTRTVRKPVRPHRLSYEMHKGIIPDGLEVMHSCDVRTCCNPQHLSVGTKSDNMQDAARKGRVCTIGQARLTRCKRGHEFTDENTYRRPNGHRRCKTCYRLTRAIRSRSNEGGEG